MQQEKRIRIVRAAACAAAAVALGPVMSHGAVFEWNAASGDWDVSANWTPEGPPTADDRAVWSTGVSPTPSTVNLTQNEEAGTLDVTDREVQFNLNNFSLTFNGADPIVRAGAPGHDVSGNDANVTFAGPGTVNFQTNVLRLGWAGQTDRSRVAATGGATVNTAGVRLGDYQGGGEVSVSGAGTIWNNEGFFRFGRSGGGNMTPPPRYLLSVTNGGVFNHNTDAGDFSVPIGDFTARVVVEGPGSQLNFTGANSGNFQMGGYNTTHLIGWEITNGGVVSSTVPLGLAFNNSTAPTGPGLNTYLIEGNGARMSAPQIALSGRSHSDIGRGPSVVTVGVGGTLEATTTTADFAISVGQRGVLSLQGGTVSIQPGQRLTLRDTGIEDVHATLEGHGTITGGQIWVEGSSIVSPGLESSPTGTITGEAVTLLNAQSAAAQLLFDLSTGDGSHDRIELLGEGSAANIAGVLTYNNLDAAMSDFGIMDFLIAGAINYNTADAAVSLGDIPMDTDNLDSIMSAAGYTRVFDTPTASGEYRYFIAADAVGDLSALRLQVVPEPATLGLLGLGGLLLLRRRG